MKSKNAAKRSISCRASGALANIDSPAIGRMNRYSSSTAASTDSASVPGTTHHSAAGEAWSSPPGPQAASA